MNPQEVLIRKVNAGRCLECDGPLTDPDLSPGGYRHCFRCRVGYRISSSTKGDYVESRRHPPRPRRRDSGMSPGEKV